VCYEVFSLDDPLPVAGDLLGMIRKYASPRAWRTKVGNRGAGHAGPPTPGA
jgi:hypothetical protein